jgi:hypothetical protein
MANSLQLAAYLRVAAYAIAFFECVPPHPSVFLNRLTDPHAAICRRYRRNIVYMQDRRAPATSRVSTKVAFSHQLTAGSQARLYPLHHRPICGAGDAHYLQHRLLLPRVQRGRL